MTSNLSLKKLIEKKIHSRWECYRMGRFELQRFNTYGVVKYITIGNLKSIRLRRFRGKLASLRIY